MPVEVPANKLVPQQTIIHIYYTDGKRTQRIFGVYVSHDESHLCYRIGYEPDEPVSLPLCEIRKIKVMSQATLLQYLNNHLAIIGALRFPSQA